jgi:hypothetical protein
MPEELTKEAAFQRHLKSGSLGGIKITASLTAHL